MDPDDPTFKSVERMLEQQETIRKAMEPFEHVQRMAEQERAMRDAMLGKVDFEMDLKRLGIGSLHDHIREAQLAFDPLRKHVEEFQAQLTRDQDFERLVVGFADDQSSIRKAIEAVNARDRAMRVSIAGLDADLRGVVGSVAEQTRAFAAIGAANASLSAMLARESAAAHSLRREIDKSFGLIARLTEISLAAQERVASIHFESLGRLAGLDSMAREAAAGRFSNLAESYQDFAGWLNVDVGRVHSLPHLLLERPSREIFASANVLRVLSPRRQRFEEEERSLFADDLDAPITELLAELHPELPRKLIGAARVLEDRSNPDRVGQAANSMVEVVDHSLRIAAPDERVMPWAQPNHFDEKDPRKLTRAARWEFLTRDLGDAAGLLHPFLEANMRDMRGLLKELQGGKHGLAATLTPGQAKVLLARVHGVARLIVIVWRIGRD